MNAMTGSTGHTFKYHCTFQLLIVNEEILHPTFRS